jgi:hypothetical protein
VSGVIVFALEVLERMLLSSRHALIRELGIALARGAR